MDLFRMAKELQISIIEWLDRYGECYIGEDSRVPIIRIRPIGETRKCPLLKNNKCSIHKAKPSVCRIYPLGRALRYALDGQGKPNTKKPEVIYFHSGCFCVRQTGNQTVKDWLEEFGLLENETFFIQWSQAVADISMFLRKLEDMITDQSIMVMVWNMVFGFLYVRYDIGKEFQSQFERNIIIIRLLEKMPKDALWRVCVISLKWGKCIWHLLPMM